MKRNCLKKEAATHKILGDLYGLWIQAEVEASILTRDGDNLRRFENMRNEHFDSFSDDINQDKMNSVEEDRVQSNREGDGKQKETVAQSSKTEKNFVAGGVSCQKVGGNGRSSENIKECRFTGIAANTRLKIHPKEDQNRSQEIRVSIALEKSD